MKSVIGLMVLTLAALSLPACRRGEARDVVVAASTSAEARGATGGMSAGPHAAPRRLESVVKLSASVKAKWKAVKIAVLDLTEKKETTYVIPVDTDFTLPGSGLTVRPLALVPDFTMDAGVITSKSDEAKNPAAQVSIHEGGREIFKGWLFARFPETHPFEHPRYALRMIELVPA